MSPGMVRFLLWAAVILVVAYAFNINIPVVVGGFVHSLQQMHGTNSGHP